jgi:hypothetical protein
MPCIYRIAAMLSVARVPQSARFRTNRHNTLNE